ncbi:hypothetical protein SEA_CHASER_2 [Mycobacterium phage Chaser]|nr:hypothetical protein SEA_CHASER_2 [Mycobacterium phage Chaser]
MAALIVSLWLWFTAPFVPVWERGGDWSIDCPE